MKLSTTLNLFILDPDRGMRPYYDEIRNYKELGFDSLDFILCNALGKNSPLRRDDWMDFGKRIAEFSEMIGIDYYQSHLPYYNFAYQGRDPDRDEMIRRSVIMAGIVGSKWTVTHPATDYDLPSTADSFRKNYDYFAPYVELAEKNGVGVAFENMADFREPPFMPWYCAHTEELIGLCDSYGSNTGICWDFGHANLVYPDQNPCLREVGKRLKAVHVHDNWGQDDNHLPVFFGNVKWEPLMHTLVEIGYEGLFSFEVKRIPWTLPLEMRNAQWRYVRTSGEYLLSLIGE